MSSAIADPNSQFGDRTLGNDLEWGHTGNADAGSRPQRNNGLTKHIFHGLATLLVVSLACLLLELNSPGMASRLGQRLFRVGGTHAPVQQYYSPVPAPFLSPKSSRFAQADAVFAPTSEPTIQYMAGQYITVPTSEPTELSGPAHVPYEGVVPTYEPTSFGLNKPTSEPTLYVKNGGLGQPSSEPTVYTPGQSYPGQSNPGQTTYVVPTSEPTVFTKVSSGQTSPSSGSNGSPTTDLSSPTSEPTVFIAPGVPTGGATVTQPSSEPTVHVFVNRPTSEPTIHVFVNPSPTTFQTFQPTSFISFAPTSDPTLYPTPEPSSTI